MREMLKRRQFIFGKQNTNRHQPQVDDVVTSIYTQYNNASNISDDGGSDDAVMKFAPTKKEVIDIVKYGAPSTVVFNISEEDVEFVDTFLYKDSDYDHIGYVYKFTKGSVTASDSSVLDLSDRRIMCAGPVLASDGKIAYVTTRPSDVSDRDYIDNLLGTDMPLFDHSIPKNRFDRVSIVTDFDPSNTDISITQLQDPPSYVNITTDVLPYIINHIYLRLVDSSGK